MESVETEPISPDVSRTLLSDLRTGQCAIVAEVKDEADLQRLKAMGICAGRYVELVKRGDPLIVKAFASRIGISARLAEQVWVEPCQQAERCWLRMGPPLTPSAHPATASESA